MATLIHLTNFAIQADSGPMTGANNTTSWGDGWIDLAGGSGQVRSGSATFTSSNYTSPTLRRPEAVTDPVFVVACTMQPGFHLYAWLRPVAGGTDIRAWSIYSYNATQFDFQTAAPVGEQLFPATPGMPIWVQCSYVFAGPGVINFNVTVYSDSGLTVPIFTTTATGVAGSTTGPYYVGLSAITNGAGAITSVSVSQAAALSPAARAAYARPASGLVPRQHRGGRPTGTASKGSNVTLATSSVYYKATADLTNPRLLYSNLIGGVPSVVGPNPVTYTAAIEYPSGSSTRYQATWSGSTSVTLAPGGHGLSDPMAVVIPAGAMYGVYTCTSVATASMSWPTGYPATGYASLIPGYTAGAGTDSYVEGTDTTLSGTMASDNAYRATAVAIFGDAGPTEPSVLIIGDSITAGQGANVAVGSWGMLGTAGAGIGALVAANPGESLADVLTGSNFAAGYLRFTAYGATHAVVMLGTNDLSGAAGTLQNMKWRVQQCWSLLARQGIAVYGCTLLPHSVSSTDNFATVANQTVPTDGSEQIRTAFNDWIRTTPAPLAGYIETADTVETARNSGLWKVNGSAMGYTVDGVHPSGGGHAAAGAALTPVAATWRPAISGIPAIGSRFIH